MSMTISDLSRRSGCTPPTIRYYESIGLIARAARTAGGRRAFGSSDVERLQFVRRARAFGMSIEQVRKLIEAAAAPVSGCGSARGLIQQRLDDIAAQRAELAQLEESLVNMAIRCDSGCGMGSSQPCNIFDDITGAR